MQFTQQVINNDIECVYTEEVSQCQLTVLLGWFTKETFFDGVFLLQENQLHPQAVWLRSPTRQIHFLLSPGTVLKNCRNRQIRPARC
jgi:hypothetical protein